MSKFDTAWKNDETGEIHTPKARMVYPTLLEAKRIKDKPDSKPKFTVTLLLPKAANIDLLKAGLVEALKGKFGAEWQKKKGLNFPLLKTEDQERLQQYAGEYPLILRCSANQEWPPFVYGPDAKQFNGSPSDIYSGRWAVVAGTFYAYDNVSKGVNFGLNKIQLLDHDEPVAGGRVATASGFEQVSVKGTAFDGDTSTKAKTTDDVLGGDDLNDDMPF